VPVLDQLLAPQGELSRNLPVSTDAGLAKMTSLIAISMSSDIAAVFQNGSPHPEQHDEVILTALLVKLTEGFDHTVDDVDDTRLPPKENGPDHLIRGRLRVNYGYVRR
jgi:hypothetical protein